MPAKRDGLASDIDETFDIASFVEASRHPRLADKDALSPAPLSWMP